MKRLKNYECPLGQVKRYIVNVTIDSPDAHAYCGTRSGDILEISLDKGMFQRSGPVNQKFGGAVNQVISKGKNLYIGTSDGTFAKLDKHSMLTQGQVTYPGCSISALCASSGKIYAISNRGAVRCVTEGAPLEQTSVFMQGHCEQINSIAFPSNYGEIFAVASGDEIRVWTNQGRELLRIELMQDNQYGSSQCNQVALMPDGKSIISGWTDGKIRSFLPQSGKMYWIIHDAHLASST